MARLAGRLSGVPTLYTPHGLIMSSPEIPRAKAAVYTAIERMLGHWATTKFLAVSEGERDFALQLGLAPEERTTVIENGIGEQELEKLSEIAKEENLDTRPLTFGSTMRFDAQKAPGQLIEAFSRLNKALPDLSVRLVIAGDGKLLDEARRRVESEGISDKVLFLGWTPDVREVLRQLDIFVVSSLYEAGLSYSTMEAMAARLPVVSTNVFGTTKPLTEVPGNVLVPVGDVEALALGMQELATRTDPGSLGRSLRNIGQANHDYIGTHFRQSDITRRIIEAYRSCCRPV